jgi:phage shock protein PspC (stress-responsive transcriptional regulator)
MVGGAPLRQIDRMSETPPTNPLPEQPEQPPRRLTRSTTDRMIGGVAGGLGRHLNIDPLAVRITFVILVFAGGLGIVAYLLCLLFVPSDDPDAPPVQWGLARTLGAGLLAVAALAILLPDWAWGPAVPLLAVAGAIVYLLIRMVRDDGGTHAGRVAAKIAIGIVLVALAVGGLIGAAAGSALGGGVIVAGLVIACGVGLVGGAFRGGARWLIVPALVLALPLGAVAATDLDVRGTWGERTFRPATVAEVERGYEMGLGEMSVDMRDVDFPAGRTELPLEIGMGEIQVLVPRDLCVTTEADIGMGAFDAGDGEQGGIDLNVDEGGYVAPGVEELHLVGDIGIGALFLGHDFRERHGPRWNDGFDTIDFDTNRLACEGDA